jgi:Acetyltransferases
MLYPKAEIHFQKGTNKKLKTANIIIAPEDPTAKDAVQLMAELSECLRAITGSGGENSFQIEDVLQQRSLFVIAREPGGAAVGCGALRAIDGTAAELKRIYARTKGNGIGKQILSYLESEAYKMGYSAIVLETRRINRRAVSFYRKNGYAEIHNYGKYKGNADAICFKKALPSLIKYK